MSKKHIAIVLFILISVQASAFDLLNPVGGRSAGMGRSSVALTDFWSIQNNPAGLSTLASPTAGIFYENRFLMKELGFKSAAFGMPLNWGVIGVSASQFGYSEYNENKIGLAYSRQFSPKLRLGMQLDYLLLNYADVYSNRQTFTFEIGLQSQLTEKVCVGAYVFNPARVDISTSDDYKMPIVMRLGVSYAITRDFIGQFEIEDNTDYGFSVRMGAEYQIIENLNLRAGVQTNPGIFTFGLGYEVSFLTIDLSAQMHEIYGASLQAGLTFKINNNK